MKRQNTLVHDWKGEEIFTYDIVKVIPQGNWESGSTPWIGVVIAHEGKYVFVKWGEHGIEYHQLKPSLYMRFEKIGDIRESSDVELLSNELFEWLIDFFDYD